MSETVRLVAGPADAGERLDVVLARSFPGRSRSSLAALVKGGGVVIEGRRADKPSFRLKGGEELVVELPPAARWELRGEDIPVAILYQDDDLIVVDKPAGLVVHPARGHASGTLVNALLGRMLAPAPVDEPAKPGIVHRLDKDTSGCLVISRTAEARDRLQEQFRRREVGKRYLAVVHGAPPAEGTIDAPIGRDPRQRKRMHVGAPRSRPALSRFRVVERFARASLLDVEISTGRTHQIRVHLASWGYPVVGDRLYGGGRKGGDCIAAFPRQALHACEIRFRHPRTGEEVVFSAPLPIDMVDLLSRLREGSPSGGRAGVVR